ncbi:hypothetical protein AVEN_173431-1 [Araneus ventricosus]|uniref:Uncharacterized protein n=1 Tax=Araneus ventricosus TaxID=182803 RepID=A0A4Y2QSF6_ARAVE|nr:hypothetical protein AVEN_173431-1 [Araneus ventricosus]
MNMTKTQAASESSTSSLPARSAWAPARTGPEGLRRLYARIKLGFRSSILLDDGIKNRSLFTPDVSESGAHIQQEYSVADGFTLLAVCQRGQKVCRVSMGHLIMKDKNSCA